MKDIATPLLHLYFFTIEKLLKGKLLINRLPVPGSDVPSLGEILFNKKHFDKSEFHLQDYSPKFLLEAEQKLPSDVMEEVNEIFFKFSEMKLYPVEFPAMGGLPGYVTKFNDLEDAFFTEFFFWAH